MIFASIPTMIVIDLIIIGLVALMLVLSYSFGMFTKGRLPRTSRLLIVAGVVLTGLFYLTDLLIMCFVPMFIDMESAMSVMTTLHLEVRWPVSLLSLLLIGSGMVLSAHYRQQTELQMLESDRKIADAQDRIVESEIRFRALVDQTPDSVFCFEFEPAIPVGLAIDEQIEFGHDSYLVECNQVFADIIRRASPAEAIGMRLRELDSAQDTQAHNRLIRDFIENGYRLVDYEFRHKIPDGRQLTWQVSMSGVVRRGRLIRLWGSARDMRQHNWTRAELAGRLHFQEFVADISTCLLTANDDEAEQVLTDCLGRVARHVRAERAKISCFDAHKQFVTQRFFWSETDDAPFDRLSPANFPVLWNRILLGEPFQITNVDELAISSRVDAASLALVGIQSIVFVPLQVGGETLGTCNFSSIKWKNDWSDQDLADLRILASLMASKVVQIETNESLSEALAELRIAKSRLEAENTQLRKEVSSSHGFDELVGESDNLMRCLHQVERVAVTATPVLLQGETGTGKELIARAIHQRSDRRDKPLIKVNCAALPANLIESELFGHEKGAFTGATSQKPGRFDLANGGTLFLDEIGEIPIELQSKLLRALQSGEFERLGGGETITVDVRVIAATNRNLQEAAALGEFRPDLYYRIAAFPITLPPLRARADDIPLLAEHFVRKHAVGLGKDVNAISAAMLDQLRSYDWPGNVRELEAIIQRALISSTGPVLDLQEALRPDVSEFDVPPPYLVVESADLRTIERQHITRILEQSDWVVGGDTGAASKLGLPASTLRSRMRKLGINRPA